MPVTVSIRLIFAYNRVEKTKGGISMQLKFVLVAIAVVAGFVGIGIGVAEGSPIIIVASIILSAAATVIGINLRRRILSKRRP